MNLAGVHHVSLNVRDLEQARAFYLDVLGLTALARPDLGFPGLWLATGAQEIHLMQVPDGDAWAGQHFAFRVEAIDDAVAELTQKGVRVSAPRQIPGGGCQAFFRDPSGNLIELNEPTR
jgi:catechol 2,3-dioxygenase-like lactoylglutathione lyase family enzyme